MAHIEQKNFCIHIKNKFKSIFTGCNVLDIGSLDVNGNNRYLFSEYTYTGLDIGPGNNVDIVCKGHEYDTDKRFDIVISTECFEHDKFYAETIKNAIRLLKSGGLFLFTCASTGRKEHGTRKEDPASSPYSCVLFDDYYKNLTEQDVREVINIEETFSQFEFKYIPISCDLDFYGIKK